MPLSPKRSELTTPLEGCLVSRPSPTWTAINVGIIPWSKQLRTL